ncbi:glycine cleavage system protein GcvH [uncultured Mycolicibacterium sp.]|jgi:glycine cleavage system H protein|uniref:glycine cleavage system protein GcvH n=1 Tax=uncultured Mycolicibacterium sp. TaxID=2320817 RepID=UPI00260A7AEB|nr:glycine cleavage system protein GcvH [uncultured Mycolicibacterium sp.]
MTNSQLPEDYSYTVEHEWVQIPPGAPVPATPVRVGITAFAVEALGDIVFVSLPEVGDTVTAGEPCGEVESTKAVSDIYAPVTGHVTAVNTAAVADPAVIGTDPYGSGWLFEVEATGADNLLSAAEYSAHTAESD